MITPDELLDFGFYDLAYVTSEASARRAVSAAYYALFHAIAHTGAACFTGPTETRTRLARSYDHTSVKAMADKIESDGRQGGMDPRLLTVAHALKSLRQARETADYDLSVSVTWVNAGERLVEALDACDALKQIASDPAAVTYLLSPLCRDRNRRG